MQSITSQDLDTVLEILQGIMFSADNMHRQTWESQFMDLRTQSPVQLVSCLVAILESNEDSSIRALSAVLLRQTLSAFDVSKTAAWKILDLPAREHFKTKILEISSSEQTKAVRYRIADALGEIAATIFCSEQSWPALIEYLFESAYSAEFVQVCNTLKIFSTLFAYCCTELDPFIDQLHAIFVHNLDTQSGEVRITTVSALCKFLRECDEKHTCKFVPLVFQLLQTVIRIVSMDEEEGKEALEFLTDLAEARGNVFKKQTDITWQFVEYIGGLSVDDLAIKHQSLEFFIALIENCPKVLHNRKDIIWKLVDSIFRYMLEVDVEIDENWGNPQESFSDLNLNAEIEIDYVQLGQAQIARVLTLTEEEGLQDYILSVIYRALQDEADWRRKYAALMTLSSLAYQINEQAQISELLGVIANHVGQNLHAKVRYSAYYILDQLCLAQEEEFSSAYHTNACAIMQQGLIDPVPRVRAHCIATISNFMRSSTQKLGIQYCPVFLPEIIKWITTEQCSYVVQEALSALSTMTEASKDHSVQYYDSIMPVLLNIIKNFTSQEMQIVRVRAIESMSVIVTQVTAQQITPYIHQIYETLTEISGEMMGNSDKITKALLNTWSRLVGLIGETFAPYLFPLMEFLLAVITISANLYRLDVGNWVTIKTKQRQDKGTPDIEAKDQAIQCICKIAQTVGKLFAPYVEPTVSAIARFVNYTANESIRASSSQGLALMVKCAKQCEFSIEEVSGRARQYIVAIWQAIQTEYDSETLTTQLTAILDIINTMNDKFLSPEEVNEFGQLVVNYIGNELDRRADITHDSEEDALMGEEEDALFTVLADILGGLLRTDPHSSLGIIKCFYESVIDKFLKQEYHSADIKFAIYVIDDIIEYVGLTAIPNEQIVFLNMITSYISSQNEGVRQACCYGIGILAKTSTPTFFMDIGNYYLQAVKSAIGVPWIREKQWGYANDNAVAALGKLLKYQTASLSNVNEVLALFISELPLRYDISEAQECHDYLADIFTANLSIMQEHIVKAIGIFTNIAETAYVANCTMQKIVMLLRQWKERKVLTNQIINTTLNESQKAKLNRLL